MAPLEKVCPICNQKRIVSLSPLQTLDNVYVCKNCGTNLKLKLSWRKRISFWAFGITLPPFIFSKLFLGFLEIEGAIFLILILFFTGIVYIPWAGRLVPIEK